VAHAIDARDKTGIYIVPGSIGDTVSDTVDCVGSKIPGEVCFIWGFVVFGAFIRSCRNQKRRRELEERRVEIITNWQVSHKYLRIFIIIESSTHDM